MLSFEWTVHQDMYVRTFLRGKGISRRLLARIKYHGGEVLLNDEPRYVGTQAVVGDRIKVLIPDEGKQEEIEGMPGPLEILFEDDHYLAVNKPAYYTSIPSFHNPQGSMANILKAYYQAQNYDNQVIHVVTRLDRDTSGVMLFAKHQFAHSLLDQSLRQGGIDKRYWAFTPDPLQPKDQGFIEAGIGRKPGSIIERRVDPDGKPALTEYQLLRETAAGYLYGVRLHTGRSHQIRVHFAYAGAPLYGDSLYGGDLAAGLDRQALHCRSLSFNHPLTGDHLQIIAPLADELSDWQTRYFEDQEKECEDGR